MADPMHQFQIQKIVELPTVTVPGLGAIDLSITNSVAAMMSAALLIIGFYALSAKKAVVPGRLQSVGEMLYGLVDGLAESIIGHDGKKFLPFIFTLFAFVLFMNVQGMFLVFTATSQLAVTLTLGLMVILTVVAVGFAKNGLKFFKLFAPSGVPWPLYFLLVPIEILSFLIRPITLGLRLFGNMLGGHVVLKIDLRRFRGRPGRSRRTGLGRCGPGPDLGRRSDGPRVHGGLPAGLRVRGARLRLHQRRRAPRQPLINL